MELDKRFKVLPFCCFGAEKCVKYIGHKGYFTNNIDFFKNIDFCIYGTLEEVHAEQADSFQMDNRKFFRYFIPECFVKQKEKQLRPYTFMEFKDIFTVGQPIKFRRKGKGGSEYEIILDGYMHEQSGDQTFTTIFIGVTEYTLQELFEEYEWQASEDTEDFKPFGVEVEE